MENNIMKKRILSIIMAILMLVMIPSYAFAEEGAYGTEDPAVSEITGSNEEEPIEETEEEPKEETENEDPEISEVPEPGLDNFSKVRTYTEGRFKDVSGSDWFADSVKDAYEYALVEGTSETKFSPSSNMTVAQAITLADRIHSIYYGDGHEFVNGEGKWYQPYIDYAISEGMLNSGDFLDYEPEVNRQQFVYIMSRSLPEKEFNAINEIPEGTIPDIKDSSYFYNVFYLFYRAGILNGSDEINSSEPLKKLRRCEAAAILIRIVDPGSRIKFETKTEITVYSGDGKTKQIRPVELPDYESAGWARYPITTLYCWNGQKKTIASSQVDSFLAANPDWANEPYSAIPSSIKSRTQTGLPVVWIDTGGKEVLSKTDYVNCTISIYNAPQSMSMDAQKSSIRLRGNASSYYGNTSKIRANPVPYRLKFDEKINMLGINNGAKCKSWVLYTNLDHERDVIKTDIAFRMGRMLMQPDGYYCSDARPCHFYLNGKFWGTYLVCEQNQANKNRVNVNEPDEGYTGTDIGYFLEMDNYYEKPFFNMNYEGATVKDSNGVSRKFRSNGYSIKTDTYSQEQKDFIANYTRGVFKIVYQACEKGNYLTFDSNYNVVSSSYTNAQDCIDAVLDLRSVVDMYILYEIMCDYDCGESSFFMCVDFSKKSKFKKLTFTAPWDFNWTCQGTASSKLFASVFRDSSFINKYGDRSNPWFIILYKQPWFKQLVKQKWSEIGGSAGISKCVNEERALIERYKPDLNRRTSGIMSGALTNLNWIEKRAQLLGSDRWN